MAAENRLKRSKPTSLYETAMRLARRNRPHEWEKMLSLLGRAAAEGDARATHALGLWYLIGPGKRIFKKGFEFERRAADLGIAGAAWNVAIAYETGRGVRKNLKAAFEYYERAAALGDPDALYEVSRCLTYGIGVRKDLGAARRWFSRALRAGVKEAVRDASERMTSRRTAARPDA